MIFSRLTIYLFLLSSTLCSLLWGKVVFLSMLGISILVILIINRGIFYTLRANKFLLTSQTDKGYSLLEKAYKTNTIPYIVVNGYIYLSLKFGYYDKAKDAIDRVFANKLSYKVKESHRNQAMSQMGLYQWKTESVTSGVNTLKELYDKGYRNTTFYGNLGCLLYLNGEYEEAEKICLEAYEFNNNDKVTLDNLVAIYIAQGRWENAEKYYKELDNLNPSFPEAYYHGAQLAYNSGKLDSALELIGNAEELEISEISSITSDDIVKLKNQIEAK